MNKQIEELKKDISYELGISYEEEKLPFSLHTRDYLAKALIEQGYQKVDKDQVVVLKTEYERLIYVEGELQEMNADYYNELKELKDSLKDSVILSKGAYESLSSKAKANVVNAVEIRKETAEKIFNNLLKEFYKRKSCGNADVVVYEIAKQYGVDLGEEQ